MPAKMLKKNTAFSLIEVSVVILIIGIFVAAVVIAAQLSNKAKLSTAKTLTISSPIYGIKDSALWLETSLDSSFDAADSDNGRAVNNWYDSNKSTTKVAVSKVGTGAIYSNSINSVHAVGFNGSTSNYLQIADASFLNKTDYTIFVLEKRLASGTNYFLGSTGSGANNSLALGYSSDTNIIHAQGSNSYTPALVNNYSESGGKARVFTFVQNSTSGKKTYVNGILASQSADTEQLSGLTSLEIGKGYSGEIGEIAIFSRALSNEERKSIEDYLGKKWTSKINRDSAVGGGSGIASCVGYTITPEGCDLATAPCALSVEGITTTSVSATSTPTSLTCDSASHYAGSITYTCSGSSASVSGSCICASGYTGTGCSSCASGYIPSGSNCILGATCSVSGTGITTTSGIAHGGTGTVPCNSGFSGSGVSYNCDNGNSNQSGSCIASTCTGGTISDQTISGTAYKLHTFTSTGTSTFNCTATKNVDVLVVAGGGGGGGDAAGGGGGGGMKYQTGVSIASGNITVTVGAGGTGGVGSSPVITASSNGGNSSFGSYVVATGGGKGGIYNGGAGSIGGSGGGGACENGTAGNGTVGQGNAGGAATSNRCGGGGGAGGVGGNGSSGGIGGAGASNDITGTTLYYSGGGGGGRSSVGSEGNNNVNANGGGGRGALSCPGTGSTAASAGTTNTGGGGGGAPHGCQSAGAGGGSGIVIVRYVN